MITDTGSDFMGIYKVKKGSWSIYILGMLCTSYEDVLCFEYKKGIIKKLKHQSSENSG